MDTGVLHGLWTLVLLITFVGITVLAWSTSKCQEFEQAARIPLEDDDVPKALLPITTDSTQREH